MSAARMEHGQPVPETKCAALWLTAAQIAHPDVEGVTTRAIQRALAAEWGRIYPDGSAAPCYDTVRLFIHSLVKVQP